MKIVWIVPEKHGGIFTYSKMLWPFVKEACEKQGFKTHDPLYIDSRGFKATLAALREIKPDIIHIQHEFGLFGRKIPGFYKFPSWVKKIKKDNPYVKIVGTAHTVLSVDHSYPVQWRGMQAPLRWMANQFLLPFIKSLWLEKTWQGLDGVIVHSETQVDKIKSAKCANVICIPHFVPAVAPQAPSSASRKYLDNIPKNLPLILIFGFISPEKGQDLAIQALHHLKTPALLVIAGSARRGGDFIYRKYCQRLIEKFNLNSKVFFPGFVPENELSEVYEKATVVLAPFRETFGSGSLVQALARGKAILTSDLPLNKELEERVPRCVGFFVSGNAAECGAKLDELLLNENKRAEFSAGALKYAEEFSAEKMGQRHSQFYSGLFIQK